MPAQLTTRAQVNGYRFLLRRLDHALIRRDVRMLHDPMRAQFRSLLSGAILALLVVAGCTIMAFIRPQGSIGDANIVVGKDSGALYVVVRDKNDKTKMTLHPALNLASARLISGTAESPKSVKDAKLNTVPRGPILGIPGAPAALPGSSQGDGSQWTICDTVQLSASGGAASATGSKTTVIAGGLELNARIKQADAGTALLVHSTDKSTKTDKNYLIYDGKRAEVDTTNTVMARSLNLAGQRARPITTGLVGAAIEVPPLVSPTIPHAGDPGPGRLNGIPVGGVIRVASPGNSAKSELYVVLSEGVQRISEFTAQVIRNTNSQGMDDIRSVTPDLLDGILPPVHVLPVDDFPAVAPKIITAEDNPVACITWMKSKATDVKDADVTEGPSDRAATSLLVGTRLPLADSASPVTISGANGSADGIDEVYIPPSTGELVRTTGMEPGSRRRDSLFYVADNGISYGLPDLTTAQVLGLGGTPRLAPWAIVGQLVPGPMLSTTDALTSYDSLPTLSK
ncbi:type VII secretion protein EccB [Nocardia sp. NBC_01503]|uniref:type VII secretion protein EccB n=1 Tax=Nocardia sp. NBC_01503 TaxID=2975997 RepID=UPI002E7BCDA3|nr:type VII secretion protein EccB [Nocardia sp. NBC_01503]WTL33909.1 type VII secretion protein EccB [Nocardia sp. NBC_01503]